MQNDICTDCKYKKTCKELSELGLYDVSCDTVKEVAEYGKENNNV